MRKDYCKSCTNAKTALCGLCASVETCTGTEKKPSYYVGIDEIFLPPQVAKINDLAAIFEARARRQQPIPIHWVLEYNKLLEVVYGQEESV